ncbi:RRM domain-containing protein [Mycena indigotica]|uniref:RRM domain-containing protein n=1 Tax=Mycena indigotica TaxID=2126181 RepID=A0A8H6W7I2_9AGAR|nr:RRM domain-containing protein [Mycena indigotica]KAF7302124.1 RRM domain-containing protein [Mycena indigotica]
MDDAYDIAPPVDSGVGMPASNGGDPGWTDDRDRDRDRERDTDRRGRSRSRSPARDGGSVAGNPGNNLHVSGIGHRIDTRDLEAAFAKIGRVTKAQVVYDPHTRESRGFGFVTMETPEEADAAIAALNGTDLGGKNLHVEKARRGRARTPTPGRYYGPPKRSDRERPYDPRPYDSRYSRDYDRGGRGGGERRYADDYDRRGGGGRMATNDLVTQVAEILDAGAVVAGGSGNSGLSYVLAPGIHLNVIITTEGVLVPADTWCSTPESIASQVREVTGEVHANGMIYDEACLWRLKETITYGFIPWQAGGRNAVDLSTQGEAEPTAYRQKTVKDALEYYMKRANLQFEQVPDSVMANLDFSRADHRQQVDIRIAFGRKTAAENWGWSCFGPLHRQYIFLPGPKCPKAEDPGPAYTTIYFGGLPATADAAGKTPARDLVRAHSTVFHELGHTLGLAHEHESPLSPTADATTAEVMVATLFDEKSIMLYSGKKYVKDPSKITKENHSPSPTDLALIRLMYPDSAKKNSEFDKAMDHMKFKDNVKKEFLENLATALSGPSGHEIIHAKITGLRRDIAKTIYDKH